MKNNNPCACGEPGCPQAADCDRCSDDGEVEWGSGISWVVFTPCPDCRPGDYEKHCRNVQRKLKPLSEAGASTGKI